MATNIICNDQDFLTSAKKYRQDLLRMPVKRLADLLPYFTVRPGIRYEEKLYTVDSDVQFGPYNPDRTEALKVSFTPRTLKTYFGSVRREFDPNEYYKTILGSSITKGDALRSVEVARLVLSLISTKLGDHLSKHIFDAVRNDDGTDTKSLFNGFDTITKTEITATNIAAEKGNLYAFDAAIDSTNAVDQIKAFCRAADDYLVDQPELLLLLPRSIYNAYLDDYQQTVGALPYNTEFRKLTPEGFENIKFVPMSQKKGSEYIQLTTKNNLLIGVNQMGDEENIVVEKHDVVKLTYFATIFFGAEYESIDSHRLLVGKLYQG